MINTKHASKLSIWAREESHVSVVCVSPHVPLRCVLFMISPNGELACRLDDEMLQTGDMWTTIVTVAQCKPKNYSKNFKFMYEITKSFKCIECFSVDQEHAIS